MPLDGSGGFLLSLLTESFAVRALIGSVAAALLALLVVRRDLVRHRTARRVTVLAPVLVAAGAAIGVAREGGAYLPQLWVASSGRGPAAELLDLLGELRAVSPGTGVNLLVAVYAALTVLFAVRRVAGARRLSRLLATAHEPVGYGRLMPLLHQLSSRMDVPLPRLVLLAECPGGAFTAGLRRPVIALDPVVVDRLDARELEGLLAHELAHLKRRDNLIGLAVGLFRDVAFFLPPVHLALRWLRREQEESADELASEVTGRPVALASSILKVWDRHREHGAAWRPSLACSAVGTLAPSHGAQSQALTERVERLLDRPARAVTGRRRRLELALAAGLLVIGGLAAWVVPAWISQDLNAYSLSFIYLPAPASAAAEAPAFATFRALTDDAPAARSYLPGPTAAAGKLASRDPALCPCLETTAQLRMGEVFTAEPARPRMLWRSAGHDAWEFTNLRDRAELQSRPLLALTDRGQQMGFFVVARSPRR